MRDILFRAKSTATNEWQYGYFAKAYDVGQIYSGNGHECVHEDTLGQFTGLTDKNGVKIFEGDIVQTLNFQTAFNVDKFSVRFVQGNFYVCLAGTIWTLRSCYEDVVVVGNIYDNPELIGE